MVIGRIAEFVELDFCFVVKNFVHFIIGNKCFNFKITLVYLDNGLFFKPVLFNYFFEGDSFFWVYFKHFGDNFVKIFRERIFRKDNFFIFLDFGLIFLRLGTFKRVLFEGQNK
jgi:hypothetical protein